MTLIEALNKLAANQSAGEETPVMHSSGGPVLTIGGLQRILEYKWQKGWRSATHDGAWEVRRTGVHQRDRSGRLSGNSYKVSKGPPIILPTQN